MYDQAVKHQAPPAGRSQLPLVAGAVLCATAIVLFFVGSLIGGASPTPPPDPNEDALAAPIGEGSSASPSDGSNPAETPTSPPADALALPRSAPSRLIIPSVDIDARLTTVGRADDGTIETPSADDATAAAWYRLGFSPGELGSAVIVGHVDTRHGPGVFHRLSTVEPGVEIEVTRSDGSVAVFTVDAVREYLKARFPAREIFDPRGRSGLVLITCGGDWDRRVGYHSNVIVYAHLTATT